MADNRYNPNSVDFDFIDFYKKIEVDNKGLLETVFRSATVDLAPLVKNYHITDDQVWDISGKLYKLSLTYLTANQILQKLDPPRDKIEPPGPFATSEEAGEYVLASHRETVKKTVRGRSRSMVEKAELEVQESIHKHAPQIGEHELTALCNLVFAKIQKELHIKAPGRSRG